MATTGYGRVNRKYKLYLENVEIGFDSSPVELFANDGSFLVISNRFYPNNHSVKISANKFVAKKLGVINVRERTRMAVLCIGEMLIDFIGEGVGTIGIVKII